MNERRSAGQIAALLRQAEVDLRKGMNATDVCRRLGMSLQTYLRCRTGHRRETMVDGGMDPKMAKQR
jgi:hypothetical protein